MISIRKHIDSYKDPLTESSLAAWRSSLLAMAQSTERAVPGLGQELNEKLAEVEEVLAGQVTPDLLEGTRTTVERELAGWADRAYELHAESIRDIREMIGLVAQASESRVQRDEAYVQHIGDLNGRLQALVQMDNLTRSGGRFWKARGRLRPVWRRWRKRDGNRGASCPVKSPYTGRGWNRRNAFPRPIR